MLAEQGNVLSTQIHYDYANPEADNTLKAVHEANQLKKKIYLKQNNGVNYIGMIIGPKGLY